MKPHTFQREKNVSGPFVLVAQESFAFRLQLLAGSRQNADEAVANQGQLRFSALGQIKVDRLFTAKAIAALRTQLWLP